VSELPSGTVTFLFTDLEGSTRLWEQHRGAMQAALARHDEILRRAVETKRGLVVKTTGDGFHAVFAAAEDAVEAAVEAQQGLSGEAWGETGPLRVRMGLHTGTAEHRGGDYFGSTLNRAGRLMAVAHGGQVVCSHATADLARDVLTEVEFLDLGEHRLRDLSRAERVFQVCGSGLRREFPALASLDAFPGNLPLQVSSFIGRGRELTRIIDALGKTRVVSLTGVGGVGKTRLALQVAADVLPQFREGAWLVELDPVRDPDSVVAAVAAVFGVTARAGQTLVESLVEFLRTKQLLLVLDNCEHLLGAVARLVENLERSCAGLVVLATSREGLGVEGERNLVVPSLRDPGDVVDLESIAAAESIQLFCERARAAKADFVLADRNVSAVVQICRRLDGVPLAIELAAARVPAMSPGVLATRLDQRFTVLKGGRRGAVERHQTLRAAIDWSYELCSEPEQRLLARLTVFSGGCTLEAAEAVCAGDGIETDQVFELLAGLVARSLVVADDTEAGDLRYRLLETIRQYGEDRLDDYDEVESLRARHAEYFADFASLVREQALGSEEIEAGRRLIDERENVITAMSHAIESDNVDLAMRLLCNTQVPGFGVGYWLRLPAEPILGLTGAPDHLLYPVGLGTAAWQAAARGDADAALARCEPALDAAQRFGDPDRDAEHVVCVARAMIAFSSGAWRDAVGHFQHAAEIARSAGRSWSVAHNLGAAAMAQTMAGDPAAAVPLATEGLAVARRTGAPMPIVANLNALAGALADEDPDRAQTLLNESLQLGASFAFENTQFGDTNTILAAARIGDWQHVLELATSSISQLHWNNDTPQLGGIFNVVARALAPNDPEAAAVLQGAARRLATSAIPTHNHSASTLGAPMSSDLSGSAPLGGASFITQLRRTTTGLLKDTLGEGRMRELRAEGEALDNDHAVAYGLDAIRRAGAGRQATP
jgi:predicted ATPase/class 3 adenylate cyclase